MGLFHVALGVALVVSGLITVLTHQAAPPSVNDGVYTTEQATRGEALYDEKCASCHGAMASITPDMAALLSDHTFRARWTSRSLGELFGVIQETMPQDDPGTLSSQQAAELVAYILSSNRLPAGAVALTDDVETLTRICLSGPDECRDTTLR